jgi:acyl-CoA synthetase (AMP-forming)/AMP-acid ligase II
MEVADLFRSAVTRFPDCAYVVEGDRASTFCEVDALLLVRLPPSRPSGCTPHGSSNSWRAIIGAPDDKWGERDHVLVVPKTASAASDTELIEFCRSRLANYKVPKSIDIVDVLSKNATDEVLKRELGESVAKQTTPNV